MSASNENWSEDVIPVETALTLSGLFRERVRRSPNNVAYRFYDERQGGWTDLSWSDVERQVIHWRQALAREDLRPGDRVAILLKNSPEWVFFDQAALSLGLVTVPLYVDDRPDSAAYLLQDSQSRVLLVQSGGHWRRIADSVSRLEHLDRVVLLDDREAPHDERVMLAEDWLTGEAVDVPWYEGKTDELASIVYTSGTTGRPKGVMLSHLNMMSVAHAALTMIDVFQQDLFLSFLPLSHTLERTGGYYLPMMAGSTVAYSRSINQLAGDLLELKPTAMIAVPRIFERVYGRIQDHLARGMFVKRLLFRLAVNVGWRHFCYQQQRTHWCPRLLLWPLLNRLVAGNIKAKLGGRLRAAVSGGASIPVPVARTFIGLGVPLLQGYGLTETSPVISVNTFEQNDPASVGVPLRGSEVKIGEEDELLVRGPGVMLGYWNNHVATREAIDAEGWLHTGDQARIENDHIYITGRLKDILVLSNGEKVPPGDMESAIALDPLIEQALVVGEARPYLSALLVLNSEAWFSVAMMLGLDAFARESLQNHKLQQHLLRIIKQQLHDFPGYAKVRKVIPMLEPWTMDEDLLTPTLKVKRAKVLQKFEQNIEALYTAH